MLRRLARNTIDDRTCDRVRVILALADRWSAVAIARLFLLDEATVARWKRAYEQRKWFTTANSGYGGKLTRAERHEVAT